MWLEILRADTRNRLGALRRITERCGLRAVGINVEQFRRQPVAAIAVRDHAKLVRAARTPNSLARIVVDDAKLEKRSAKSDAARQAMSGLVRDLHIRDQFLI